MIKTTLYLPDELKQRIKRTAAAKHISEAEVIRQAVDRFTADEEPPRPRLPLFDSGMGNIAERVDEILAEGFGRD